MRDNVTATPETKVTLSVQQLESLIRSVKVPCSINC